MKLASQRYINHLENLGEFQNRIFAMRHGEGTHNADGIIISSMERGLKEAPLTEKGKTEVRENSKTFISNLSVQGCNGKILVVASPFLRTVQTAKEFVDSVNSADGVSSGLKAELIGIDKNFRERFFGIFEGRNSGTYYQEVWEADRFDSIREKSVEKTNVVEDRVTRGIALLNEAFRKKIILIVSHADPIQIMKTATAKIPSKFHHHHFEVKPYIKPAEIVELKVKPRR